MSNGSKSITVHYPNIPVIQQASCSLPHGELIETPKGDCPIDEIENFRSRDMFLPHYSLRVLEGKSLKETVFVNREGEGIDLLGSCFFYKGNINTVLPDQQDGILSYNRTHNFKYDPNNEYRHILPANHTFHFVHFSSPRCSFNSFLPEGETWAERLREKVNKGERIVGDSFMPISTLQERALQNIFYCPLKGKLGAAMIETSITQLILLQLYALFSNADAAKFSKIPKRDVDTIHMVKEHLSDTFLHDHSMEELSMHFGMNSNKLMSVFKKVFGKTIFEHLTELRMQHALDLLRDKGVSVTEVARAVGYKNPNHFSTAFKKRFEACPSEFL